jgi:hypothetical protein
MPIPLYGFLEGDTIGLLVLADENETMHSLAEKLQEAASLRVAPSPSVTVVYREESIDSGKTVAQAGLKALDRFDVVRRMRS